eukprot:GHVU01178643.1.p1 GENE.GHVU01178643.1~~GHVU01178643.1.p1  ORF type:complete len:581 (+),score=107.00 GHVU01178643.1:323-2065(+)
MEEIVTSNSSPSSSRSPGTTGSANADRAALPGIGEMPQGGTTDPSPDGSSVGSGQTSARKRNSKAGSYRQQRSKRRAKQRVGFCSKSVGLVNVAAGLDGCDDQLLPSSFRALEADLGFYPRSLGQIALTQTLCLSISCPLWGYLADRHSRKLIMAVGSFLWGVTTMILAFANQFWQVMVLRAFNGFFLGSIAPVSQSVLSDVIPENRKGLGFGIVQLSSSSGRVLGSVITTSVAFLYMANIRGWRWSFMFTGVLSMVLGTSIFLFMEEIPRRKIRYREIQGDTGGPDTRVQEQEKSLGTFWKEFFTESFSVPSCLLAVAEGVVGTIPWSALSFMTMYLQYCNFSDLQAAACSGALLVGAMIAGPLGGLIGDAMARWLPYNGRQIVGQVAMVVRTPVLFVTFFALPRQRSYFLAVAALAFTLGSFSIAGVAVSRPILSEVVRPQHRATTFAMCIAAEGISAAALGAPIVGVLAEDVFGYQKTTMMVSEMPDDMREGNARALANSLLLLTAIPWALSFVFYSAMHFTYKKDRIAALAYMKTYTVGSDEDSEEVESEVIDGRRSSGGGLGEDRAVSLLPEANH